MKSIWLILPAVSILLYRQGGLRILPQALLLFAGTTIALQLVIHIIRKLEALRSARNAVARIFHSMPPALGFSLLVMAGVGAIASVVMLVRGVVSPADSWVFVTLGFVRGIMDSISRRSREKKRPGREDSRSNIFPTPQLNPP